MRPAFTHGRSAWHAGAVCGSNVPDARITDEPSLVSCPDCPDAAEIELVPDDAVTGDPHIMQTLRETRDGHSRKIDVVVVDATTAAAILTVYEAATPRAQAKIAGLPLTLMASLAWGILRDEAEGEDR
ncbi:hypothetical protein AB0M02_10765 [Actinoplanes sp. NPDC051861]|uniref:hypothetical protein n=1 Tax=Actinoplanes sp. NPDC051861 TaxID=3155170 RepID=UPI00344A668F